MFYPYEGFIEDIIDAFLERISKNLPDGIYCIEKNYLGEIKVIKEEIPEIAREDIPEDIKNDFPYGVTIYFRDSFVNSNLTGMGLSYKVSLYNNIKKIEKEFKSYEKNYKENKNDKKD